uniref:Disease resistance protein winged helix domain-containing protein n=1 Tax=Triticum urartu TaxID=4572 RepID=A0A8R7NYG9_TRIUA
MKEWEAFYTPFRTGLGGSMVLLTTRSPKVDFVSNIIPVELKGLPTDIFWEFFSKCAFGKHDPKSYPELQDIGHSIADRLCGSPLAAKTLGRLFNGNLTERHWRDILNNELWQLSYEENEILPALQLSYLYLPWDLKRCFAVCSIFPEDYSFKRDEIVAFWVALCFVETDGSMRLEEMGYRHMDDLRSRFLFQIDPKFPNEHRYVKHDLIHDMAQFISVGECFLMQGLSYMDLHRQVQTIRHMSIEVDNEAPRRIGGILHLKKMHSLRIGMRLKAEVSWFHHLPNILFLSLKGFKQLVKLPKSIF